MAGGNRPGAQPCSIEIEMSRLPALFWISHHFVTTVEARHLAPVSTQPAVSVVFPQPSDPVDPRTESTPMTVRRPVPAVLAGLTIQLFSTYLYAQDITGVIIDSVGGQPVFAVRVVFNDYDSVFTDIGGTFRLSDAGWQPEGNTLAFRRLGYEPAPGLACLRGFRSSEAEDVQRRSTLMGFPSPPTHFQKSQRMMLQASRCIAARRGFQCDST